MQVRRKEGGGKAGIGEKNRFLRILAALFVSLSLTVSGGCGAKETAAEETEGTAIGEDIIIEDETPDGAEEETAAGTEAAEKTDTMPEEVFEDENMLPPMDGLLMCAVERGTAYGMEYDGNDDLFYWTAVLYTIGNYPGLSPQTQITETDYVAPAAVVQQYADALFADAREVNAVPVPDELSGQSGSGPAQVYYDEAEDAYHFSLGDRGLSYARIAGVEEAGEGMYGVVVELCDVETDRAYARAWFKLSRREDGPEAGNGEDASERDEELFLYSIQDMRVLEADGEHVDAGKIVGP